MTSISKKLRRINLAEDVCWAEDEQVAPRNDLGVSVVYRRPSTSPYGGRALLTSVGSKLHHNFHHRSPRKLPRRGASVRSHRLSLPEFSTPSHPKSPHFRQFSPNDPLPTNRLSRIRSRAVMESSSMERAQFRLQQLAAHLHPEQGSLSFMACVGGARRDSRVHYARAALNDARFMRPAQLTKDSHTEEPKPPSQVQEKKADSADLVSPPMFSKPSVQDVVQPVSEPLFSRSSKLSPQEVEKEKEAAALAWAAAEEQPTHPETESIGKGYEWFPRMDVMESGSAFVVTVELPGVNADGICCEVTSDSLVISGSRSTDWWKNNGDIERHSNGNGNGNGNGSVYHRRELARGPYRAVWRLPKNADLGGISAEFIDGFLRVLVPKRRMVRYI